MVQDVCGRLPAPASSGWGLPEPCAPSHRGSAQGPSSDDTRPACTTPGSAFPRWTGHGPSVVFGWLARLRPGRTWFLLVVLLVVAVAAIVVHSYPPLCGVWTNPLWRTTGNDPYLEFADGKMIGYNVQRDICRTSKAFLWGSCRREAGCWVLTFPYYSDLYTVESPCECRTKGGWLAFYLDFAWEGPARAQAIAEAYGPRGLCFRRVLNPFKIRAIRRECGELRSLVVPAPSPTATRSHLDFSGGYRCRVHLTTCF